MCAMLDRPKRLLPLDALRGFGMPMIIGFGELLRSVATSAGATGVAREFEHVESLHPGVTKKRNTIGTYFFSSDLSSIFRNHTGCPSAWSAMWP